MQPGPSQNSNTTSTERPSQTTPNHQYGFHSPDDAAGLQQKELRRQRASSSVAGSSSDASSHSDDDKLPQMSFDEDGQHDTQTHRNAVEEYENAFLSSSPRSFNDGPGFKVVAGRSDRRSGPGLEDLPNEVLTHILSHLPAPSLAAVSLVSKPFHGLVTTPHAWRAAFSRFFPGQDAMDDSLTSRHERRGSDQDARDRLRAEQRVFTRLTALATWRSEYVIRTRLLRSLARGKPLQFSRGHGTPSRGHGVQQSANSSVTYNSRLFTPISHIDAVWNSGKKSPRFIHGTDELGMATLSDPHIAKIDNWGFGDPQVLPQFADSYPGEAQYGLGDGTIIGAPNVMDVSQLYGMLQGEGFPGGQAYFRSVDEVRGRFLARASDYVDHPAGVPKLPANTESISSVWIAKTTSVPTISEGLVGMLTGSSAGILTSYSAGIDNLDGHRLAKGEITARWALCPGVPIVGLAVDESYDQRRKAAGRIWAVALNALGEVFCLREMVTRPRQDRNARTDEYSRAQLAWRTGRSTTWELVEATRRVAHEDPYQDPDFDATYSPRSSPAALHLTEQQLAAENRELEEFFSLKAAHFRKICEGWDMRRRLEVDFAGDDGNGAGESVVVIKCGTPGSGLPSIKRFTRVRTQHDPIPGPSVPQTPAPASPPPERSTASLFGGNSLFGRADTPSMVPTTETFIPSVAPSAKQAQKSPLIEDWKVTNLVWDGPQAVQITTSTLDMSTFALLTASEDPLLGMNAGSTTSSPFATPATTGSAANIEPGSIPGHGGRFIAVGTKGGDIYIWNMRGPQSAHLEIVNTLKPVRMIHTDSPQISCLAMSALYLVHGGNDGLVQAWDPLASTLEPLRTLNSRFSSRARRRLIQAEASVHGVGINEWAAGALCIDPDPTVLRGMVSLGTHLRYWSYSSAAADEMSSKKRRLRRSSERGNNSPADRYTHTGRGVLMDYIANEQLELKREKEAREKEEANLHSRFGVGLAGLSEEEALAYAELLSREAAEREEEKRVTEGTASPVFPGPSGPSSTAPVPHAPSPPRVKTEAELQEEIEEAIRLSLLEDTQREYTTPPSTSEYRSQFVIKQKKSKRSASTSPSTSQASKSRTAFDAYGRADGFDKEDIKMDDLDYALQLSLAEANSLQETGDVETDFPGLDVKGKGKGRGQ